MKVLLVGGGGREHAIAKAFLRSAYNLRIYCISELVNPGIFKIVKSSRGEYRRGDINNPEEVLNTAKDFGVDFVFVGPEEPNFHGVPDKLEENGIPCVGANRSVAELELSKASMRDLQWKYNIPGRLWYKKFRSIEEALPYLEEYAESIALKPARQVGGKGVKVIEDFQVYLQEDKKKIKKEHAKEIIEKYMKEHDDVGYKLLIEERVWGPEYTIQCFTDGKTVLPTPAVQDNKHAFDGDLGPETGGMGSISCGLSLKWGIYDERAILTEEEFYKSVEIIKLMVEAVQKETGKRYHGIVAGQMMYTPVWGPTLIEMYSRFGDPECINVLSLLKTDFVEICEAIISEKLNTIKLEFEEKAVVVKCVCPEGYPEKRNLARGHKVIIDGEIEGILWASVDLREDGSIVSGGSRLVECVGTGNTVPEASEEAEKLTGLVKLSDGWKLFHRKDIGTESMLSRRTELAKLAREIYLYRKKKGLVGKRISWIPGKGVEEVG